jgi:hypothetical protein
MKYFLGVLLRGVLFVLSGTGFLVFWYAAALPQEMIFPRVWEELLSAGLFFVAILCGLFCLAIFADFYEHELEQLGKQVNS